VEANQLLTRVQEQQQFFYWLLGSPVLTFGQFCLVLSGLFQITLCRRCSACSSLLAPFVSNRNAADYSNGPDALSINRSWYAQRKACGE
jgi:hypothetical protein